MNTLWVVLVIFFLAGCGTITAKKMNRLSIGMSKAEVLGVMGDPATTKADEKIEILEYKLMTDMQEWWTSSSDQRQNFWIVLEHGKVTKFGRAGDWGMAQPDTHKHIIEAEITTKQE